MISLPRLLAICVVAASCLLAPSDAQADPQAFCPADRDGLAHGLIQPARPLSDLAGNWRIKLSDANSTHVRIVLEQPHSGRQGRILLYHPSDRPDAELISENFAAVLHGFDGDRAGADEVLGLVAANDDQEVWSACAELETQGSRIIIPAGREAQIQALLGDLGGDRVLEGGYRFTEISVRESTIAFVLGRHESGERVGALVLSPLGTADGAVEGRSESFDLVIDLDLDEPGARTLLLAALRGVVDADDASIYARVEGVRSDSRRRDEGDEPGVDTPQRDPRTDVREISERAGWFALFSFLSLFLVPRRKVVGPKRPLFRATQVLPVTIQLLVFTYWAIYWVPLQSYVGLILVQIVYAFAFDTALSLRRYGKFQPSFGIMPLVLSTNLLVQLDAGTFHFQFMILWVAILSKELIQLRGRHIFNPSALGISFIGIINIIDRTWGGDVAHEFAVPPNMTELVLILALVVQNRVPVVLISLSATLVLLIVQLTEYGSLALWPPVFLVVTLLATDPATSPRDGRGQVIYGAIVGASMGLFSYILVAWLNESDFYSKVMCVTFANLLAPLIVRFTGKPATSKVGERVETALSRRFNRWHIAVWLAVVIGSLLGTEGKRDIGFFSPEDHEILQTPLVVFDENGEASCEIQDVFCRPFGFAAEIRAWAQGGNSRPMPPGGFPPQPERAHPGHAPSAETPLPDDQASGETPP